MSNRLNRKAIIALWTCAMVGIFVLFGSSLTLGNGWLLALVAVMPPTIFIILSKAPVLTLSEIIAKEPRPVDKS